MLALTEGVELTRRGEADMRFVECVPPWRHVNQVSYGTTRIWLFFDQCRFRGVFGGWRAGY
jgi:hypothetical protein